MKKLLSIWVALLVVVAAACAEPEISGMSDGELLALYADVKAELAARGLISSQELTLRDGKYVIGKDIPAGTYTVTCVETEGESLGEAYSSLGNAANALDNSVDYSSLFDALGSMMGTFGMKVEILGDYGDVLKEYSLKKGDSFRITLEEGTALKISDGACALIPED